MIYDVLCDYCGEAHEIFVHRYSDKESCSTCGREMRRLISAPRAEFKGSGFYETDYRKPRNKDRED